MSQDLGISRRSGAMKFWKNSFVRYIVKRFDLSLLTVVSGRPGKGEEPFDISIHGQREFRPAKDDARLHRLHGCPNFHQSQESSTRALRVCRKSSEEQSHLAS